MVATVHLLLSFLCVYFHCKGCLGDTNGEDVIQLTSENWSEILAGEWMIEFYAEWCPYCQNFKSTWNDFAQWAKNTDVKVGKVDVAEEPALSGQFMVAQLPTIYHIKDGLAREYKGEDRSLRGLKRYIDASMWQETDPIPWYTSPTSLHMRLVGQVFQLSKQAQVVEDFLRKDYNLPTWGIFAVVAAITIVTGVTIGGIIVLMFEIISRYCCNRGKQKLPKPKKPQPPPATADTKQKEEEPSPETTPKKTPKESPKGAAGKEARSEAPKSKKKKGAKSSNTDGSGEVRKRKQDSAKS